MKRIFFRLLLFVILILTPISLVKAESLSKKLSGRILLQVESRGEAWYVNPKDQIRYYMADGNAAFNLMRNFGVGITNNNLKKFQNDKTSAKKQSGKIFLQVEESGQAYYVNFDGKLYYLKDGAEAYKIMRQLGIGISNKDLNLINDGSEKITDLSKDSDGDQVPDIYDIHPNEKSVISNKIYKFKTNGSAFLSEGGAEKKEYTINALIPHDMYYMYTEFMPHKFNSDYSNIKDFITPNNFVIAYVALQLNNIAVKEKMAPVQVITDFVQQMNYNSDNLTTMDEYPKYPIETLMDGSGDCEDLSFLLTSLLWSITKRDLNQLNYALLLYDTHVAVGISVSDLDNKPEKKKLLSETAGYPLTYFTVGLRDYLYTETTNDSFEIGQAPEDIKNESPVVYEVRDVSNFLDSRTLKK